MKSLDQIFLSFVKQIYSNSFLKGHLFMEDILVHSLNEGLWRPSQLR